MANHADTIVACATAPGVAGIAIIRVSGPMTRFVLETMANGTGQAREARHITLRRPGDGEMLDRCIVLFFPGPASFTGEDVAEFHLHGSKAVTSIVLDTITGLGPDIRHAVAGEFTRRAFDNGKMDLAAVEGLADLIDSETEWQRRQALRLMEGALGRLVGQWREDLLTSLAYLDAELDFMDEGDVGDGWALTALSGIETTMAAIGNVLSSARFGERVRDGFHVVILGAPNVGKSSLMNVLAGRDVSIVTPVAGTTRDVLEVKCDFAGLPVTLSDTAGLRSSSDEIEIEGMRRALSKAHTADLVLRLRSIDSEPWPFPKFPGPVIEVMTKVDLGFASSEYEFAVSTVTGMGLAELAEGISKALLAAGGIEPALVSQARQREKLAAALEQLHAACLMARSGVGEASELAAENLRLAIRTLEELIGKAHVDDVLDRVFSRFCIGK